MPFMALMMHTQASDTEVSQAVRAAVRQVDRDMPVEELDTLDHIVTQTIAQPKFRSTLLSMFAGAALLLAIVGVYGVLKLRRWRSGSASWGSAPRSAPNRSTC